MPKRLSAGLVLYRVSKHGLEVFLVHPGGPYFAHQDEGAFVRTAPVCSVETAFAQGVAKDPGHAQA